MKDRSAYIAFKNYCQDNNLTESQVEALTKEQAESVAGVSLRQEFFDNVKAYYLRQMKVDCYEKARQFLSEQIEGGARTAFRDKFPDFEICKRRVGDTWVIEIWLEGKPFVEVDE